MYNSNIVMAWRKTRRGNCILGSKCKKCSSLFFPSRRKCAKCESFEMEDYKFKGTGEVYSHSTIHYPPAGFEKQVPYSIAIVKLDEGSKITAQIIEFDEIRIGMKVEFCVRKVRVDGETGIIHYGIKFRPAG